MKSLHRKAIQKVAFSISKYTGIFLIVLIAAALSCTKNDVVPSTPESDAAFLSFSSSGQTLPTFIHGPEKEIKLEVRHSTDVKNLVPLFEIPPGVTAYANGVKQVSGMSSIDLSKPVTYELKDGHNNSSQWNVSVTPLRCKIVIDASHDGGVWWYPQYEATGFNAELQHQGQLFAKYLRAKGFEVTELGRGKELTEEMFFGSYIVVRVAGFETYTANELKVYTNLINRGMNLAFFTDHRQNDRVDELGDLLGLDFKGTANGVVTNFAAHEVTSNMISLNYIAGSVITNADSNPSIKVLGWLRVGDYADLNFNGVRDANEPSAAPVMGILTYPKSKVFFIGDTNGLEVQPQPFVDNLIHWMGGCVLD